MVISANTLFHFTKDYMTLLSILKTKFYPRLCVEKCLWDNKGNLEFAIPVVCFCDIPLSSISDHAAKYGGYAIGLRKSWAIDHGVSPILYVHNKSVFVQQCKESFKGAIELAGIDGTNSPEKLSKALSMFFMMKQYEGVSIIDGKHKKVRYYDEREWRYIPSLCEKTLNFLHMCDFSDKQKWALINKENEQYGVSFTPDDINYIIVQCEEEIVPLIHELSYIKGSFPHKSVELLTSRILSMERIREDF